MAVSLLTLILILSNGQEPEKTKQDSTAVDVERTVVERKADTLHLQQTITKMKLDSIIEQKKMK